MIDIDLARAANSNATAGKVRAQWSGGRIVFDEEKFLDLVVRATAARMSANLSRGLKPDGSGAMPGRKKDGLPRGMGSGIARNLQARLVGPLTWFIAAHLEIPGHLARIMRDVPLRAPPMDAIRDAVHGAFLAARGLASRQLAAATGDTGTMSRASQLRGLRHARRQVAASLSTLGITRRSRLASRIRKLARSSLGGRR